MTGLNWTGPQLLGTTSYIHTQMLTREIDVCVMHYTDKIMSFWQQNKSALTFLQVPEVRIMNNVLHGCSHVLSNGRMPVRYESCYGKTTCNHVVHA